MLRAVNLAELRNTSVRIQSVLISAELHLSIHQVMKLSRECAHVER